MTANSSSYTVPTSTPMLSAALYTGEPVFDVRPDPDVITEIDGWRMEAASSMFIPWLYNTCSVLSHQCPQTKWRQWMALDDTMDHKGCPCCGEDIPESVLTVWHLYNADDIAKCNKQLNDRKPQEYPYDEEQKRLYEDSSPLWPPELGGPWIYNLKGELLNPTDEVTKWNGTPDTECDVWLYNANGEMVML